MLPAEKKLRKKILADTCNAIVFKKREDVFLVGGYLRDVVTGVRSHDRDYVVSDCVELLASEVQSSLGGSLIRFREDKMIRLALAQGQTLDFTLTAGSIEKDLSARDFTINALAWSPQRGLLDRYNSVLDIRKRTIRAISAENFKADPLRMLRAYRFAAELDGSIERRTRAMVKQYHEHIKQVSSERITLEIFHLLNRNNAAKYLKMASTDELLTDIFPNKSKRWNSQLRELSYLERRLTLGIPPKIKVLLKRVISQNLSYKGMLCLQALLQGDSSPNRLRLSNAIQERIAQQQRCAQAFGKRRQQLSATRLFDIFQYAGEAVLDCLVLSDRLDLYPQYTRFRTIQKKGILPSSVIMQTLGLSPGPELGNAILNIKRAQFEGTIRSQRDALRALARPSHPTTEKTDEIP